MLCVSSFWGDYPCLVHEIIWVNNALCIVWVHFEALMRYIQSRTLILAWNTGVCFRSTCPKVVRIAFDCSLLTLKEKVHTTIRVERGLELKKLYYREPRVMVDGSIKYKAREVCPDDDL
ncbi:hypothetical protein VNO80_06601 [Phaseolus coccineus]|uniref:Uncharacterized protein n=1 Tax=Phaseolus coccineus TaxID=3886 RepID=A0AAN9RNZ9_PHACN